VEAASSVPIGSVAIPAHNEAAVIGRCLDALLDGGHPGELEVVVVCNGSTDEAADIVRSKWPSVRVIEIPEASKPAALRVADESLVTFPRIYLDADVSLPGTSARRLIEALRSGSSVAARPRYIWDVSRSDVLVRSYYRGLARVQSGRNSLWGGIYGLSQEGRSRFSEFPDLIADDLFVDQSFSPAEIEIVDVEDPAVIAVPRGILDLFRVVRRRRKGNADLSTLPGDSETTTSSTVGTLLSAARSGPGAAIDAFFFFAFAIIIRISVAVSPPTGWSRDDSSRSGILNPADH
jgi:glycosyltransferase involved in cell wall biosynthesis